MKFFILCLSHVSHKPETFCFYNNSVLGTFSSSYKITIGADFAIKSLEWNEDTRINVQLWDIAGHERFGYLTGVYYRYA